MIGEQYIVLMKRKYDSKTEALNQFNVKWKAEQYASDIYKKMSVHKVAVFRGNRYGLDILEQVFMCESLCNHTCVQGVFTFLDKQPITFICDTCGKTISRGQELHQIAIPTNDDEEVGD